MFKNVQGFRLGFFVFLGILLIFVSIFMIGNKDSLFVETFKLKTYFSTVEGLRNGATVRLSGMDVGSVKSIEIIQDTSINNVEVVFEIQKEYNSFIRLDSEVTIETEGIVGAKLLNISPGSAKYEIVRDGGIVKGKNPINMGAIITETTGIISYTRKITEDFADIVKKINEGQGTIGKLVNDEKLYNSTVRITQNADKSLSVMTNKLEEISGFVVNMGTGLNRVVIKLDSSIADIQHMVSKTRKGEGLLGKMMNDEGTYDSVKTVINNLIRTTKMTQEGAESFMENMEALKHNWLFKSYFEQRGYWDKTDYEKKIEEKLEEIKKQNELLDERIKKLQSINTENESRK